MIQVTSEQAERVHLLLGGIQKNAPNRAFYNALNRGLGTARTHAGKQIRQHYHIKQQDITRNTNMKLSRASVGDLTASISFAGTVIPLQQFKVNPSSPRQQTVSVSVLRAEGGKRLAHAYVANLGRYGPGVFERLTSKRATSQQLYGPSAAHMMERPAVLENVATEAQKTVDTRLEHEITRFLNGYGV